MNYTFKIFILLIIWFLPLLSLSQVKDIDGNQYNTITINNQEWMKENLNVEHYRNGDRIPQVQNPNEWSKLTTGAWCYYNNNTENGIIYGKLYNWYAVNDPRGLTPKGWSVPSDWDWSELIDLYGGDTYAGCRMRDTKLWKPSKYPSTNESGLSVIPGGYRRYDGTFLDLEETAEYWSSTKNKKSDNYSFSRKFVHSSPIVFRHDNPWSSGFYVRCIKNSNTNTSYNSADSRLDLITILINDGNHTPLNYLYRGNVYFDLNKYENAIRDYSKAIELNSTYGEAYKARALSYYWMKNYVKSIQDFTNAISNNVKDGDVYFHRADCYSRTGNIMSAIEDYIKCTNLDPNNSSAHGNLGWLYIYIEKYARAIHCFNKAIEFKKTYNKDAMLGLSIAYFKHDDIDLAKKTLISLINEVPDFKKGMLGVSKLESEGMYYSNEDKKYIRELLDYYGYVTKNSK